MASVNRKLSEIIDALEIATYDSDSLIHNVKRSVLQRYAVKGLREFIEKSKIGEVRGLKRDVYENNSIDLPEDYMKYVRISEVTDCGKLVPLAVDASISTANVYLLDHLDRILLDDDGVALLGSGDEDINRNCTIDFDYSNCPFYGNTDYYSGYYGNYASFFQYRNMNNTFVPDVKFKEDVFNNKIQFSGRQLTEVVVEYIYDPMKSAGSVDDLDIHAMFADALEKYVIKEIIGNKRSVNLGEKERARRDYREAILEAKIAKNIFTSDDLSSTTNLK
jgi:hypothetical protein